VRIKKTNASEPLMTCRKTLHGVETGIETLSRETGGGGPVYGSTGVRHEGGVILIQAWVRNVGTCRSDAKSVSEKAAKAIRQRMRRWQLHQRNDLALEEIALWTHPMLRGWVGYYGRFHASARRRALRTLDDFLVRWAQRKYKRLRAHKGRAW